MDYDPDAVGNPSTPRGLRRLRADAACLDRSGVRASAPAARSRLASDPPTCAPRSPGSPAATRPRAQGDGQRRAREALLRYVPRSQVLRRQVLGDEAADGGVALEADDAASGQRWRRPDRRTPWCARQPRKRPRQPSDTRAATRETARTAGRAARKGRGLVARVPFDTRTALVSPTLSSVRNRGKGGKELGAGRCRSGTGRRPWRRGSVRDRVRARSLLHQYSV